MVRVVIRGVGGVDVAGGDGGLRPGQCVERGEQCGLVVFGGEHEPGAAVMEVLGVGSLGVQCVSGDHRPGQVDSGVGEGVEQRGELGDFACLRADLHLAPDQTVVMGRGGEQMCLVACGVDRAAHGLGRPPRSRPAQVPHPRTRVQDSLVRRRLVRQPVRPTRHRSPRPPLRRRCR